jgi:hypothetical protein
MSERFAVETPGRLYVFDTFDEASRFADLQAAAGRYVISIYRADLMGPFTDGWRTGQTPTVPMLDPSRKAEDVDALPSGAEPA